MLRLRRRVSDSHLKSGPTGRFGLNCESNSAALAHAIMRHAFVVVPILCALFQVGCYWLPTEEHLVGNFQMRRPLFDRLIKMAAEDKQFRRISGGEIPPQGMLDSRYQQYLAIFRTLEIQNGLTRDLSPAARGVYILAGSEVPIGGRSRDICYFY